MKGNVARSYERERVVIGPRVHSLTLAATLFCLAWAAVTGAAAEPKFDFESLRTRAQSLAAKPQRPPDHGRPLALCETAVDTQSCAGLE